MFKSIVVGFDGSAHASRALEIGAGLAARDDISLGIVYVIDAAHMHIPEEARKMGEIEHLIEPAPKMIVNFENAPATMISSVTQASEDSQAAMFQYADFLVAEAVANCRDSGAARTEGKISLGDPAEKIVEYASDCGADLIITGSRGFGKIKSLLHGSTSQKIAQLASCSCLTVK